MCLQQLMEHAKEQCDALREAFDRTKRAILNGILAEKENVGGGEGSSAHGISVTERSARLN